MKQADNRYLFGGAYDHWKTSDPADDLPEKLRMTDDLVCQLAITLVDKYRIEAIQRIVDFYLNDEKQFHEDWEEFKSPY